MKREPLDEGIRQELETIAYAPSGTASQEERLARWRVLFDQVGGHQGLRDTEFGDVERLVGWGWAFTMGAGQYHEAAQLIEPLLRHPDFQREESVYRAHLLSRAAKTNQPTVGQSCHGRQMLDRGARLSNGLLCLQPSVRG
jgi:hypothetical protein